MTHQQMKQYLLTNEDGEEHKESVLLGVSQAYHEKQFPCCRMLKSVPEEIQLYLICHVYALLQCFSGRWVSSLYAAVRDV